MVSLFRVLLLSVCLIGCRMYSKGLNPGRDSEKYKLAYDYVINDQYTQGKTINIADSIVHIDMSIFFEELRMDRRQSEEATLRNLDSLDHLQGFVSIYNRHLIELQSKRFKQSDLTLFFSKVYDSLLVAEVIPTQGSAAKESYAKLTLFNTGVRYLFLFDKKSGQIKRAYKKDVQYN